MLYDCILILLSVFIIIYDMIIMALFDLIRLYPNPVLTGVFVFIVGYLPDS